MGNRLKRMSIYTLCKIQPPIRSARFFSTLCTHPLSIRKIVAVLIQSGSTHTQTQAHCFIVSLLSLFCWNAPLRNVFVESVTYVRGNIYRARDETEPERWYTGAIATATGPFQPFVPHTDQRCSITVGTLRRFLLLIFRHKNSIV